MRALWRHPHRCITPPVGLSTCRLPSGTNCLLFIEQLRSTSSLQSMILSQMQSPDHPLYSNKQALDWLIQVCLCPATRRLSPVPHSPCATCVACFRAGTPALAGAADAARTPQRQRYRSHLCRGHLAWSVCHRCRKLERPQPKLKARARHELMFAAALGAAGRCASTGGLPAKPRDYARVALVQQHAHTSYKHWHLCRFLSIPGF